MSEPIYQTMLGLYLTVEEYRKHVVPGQTVYLWMPPNFDRVEGIAGEGLTADGVLTLVKIKSGLIQVTDDNVHLFQPGPLPRKK